MSGRLLRLFRWMCLPSHNCRYQSASNSSIKCSKSNSSSLAERESISIDQLVSLALAAQVSALLTKDYIEERASRGSYDKALEVLPRVPDIEPAEHDCL
jgi:hypothetical protein